MFHNGEVTRRAPPRNLVQGNCLVGDNRALPLSYPPKRSGIRTRDLAFQKRSNPSIRRLESCLQRSVCVAHTRCYTPPGYETQPLSRLSFSRLKIDAAATTPNRKLAPRGVRRTTRDRRTHSHNLRLVKPHVKTTSGAAVSNEHRFESPRVVLLPVPVFIDDDPVRGFTVYQDARLGHPKLDPHTRASTLRATDHHSFNSWSMSARSTSIS